MISPAAFDTLYDSIEKEDPDLFYIESGLKYVDLEILIDELGFRGIELSADEQNKLFAELFFRDKIIVKGLPDDFDYAHYEPVEASATSTPPRRKAYVGSPGNTRQGRVNTCFAHVAANMIIHNVYKLTLEDESLYVQNNCNKYLDTTEELGDYGTIEKECGKSGAIRILLFHYIYKVITRRYGFNHGPLGNSILFYLQQPFQDDIFSPELNEIIREEFQSKDLSRYSLSVVPIDKFDVQQYDRYFEEYYASVHVREPAHFFTIVGIDKVIHGKDSSTGKAFTIPIEQFQSTGAVTINASIWKNMSFVYLLFESSSIDLYPEIVKRSIEDVKISETPTPTRDLGVRPRAEVRTSIRQPDFLGAEESVKAESGGKKSRKRKKKTRRKRSRKN